MGDPTIFTEAEQSFLREPNRRGVEYMIVGLAAAALQGVPAVTQDIDLWFKDLSDRRQDRLVLPVPKDALTTIRRTAVPRGKRSRRRRDVILAIDRLRSESRPE